MKKMGYNGRTEGQTDGRREGGTDERKDGRTEKDIWERFFGRDEATASKGVSVRPSTGP